MSDGNSTVYSNVVYLDIIETEPIVTPIIIPSGGGGGGGSSAVQVPKEVPSYVDTPVSFRLITPQYVTTYANHSMKVPINIFNSNFTMENLKLKVVSSNKEMSAYLSQDTFPILQPKEQKYITLFVDSYQTYGMYEIMIEAEGEATSVAADGYKKKSKFTEKSKIFVNSLLKSESNESQVETKLAFAQDLLTSNPECLELSEFLKKIRQKYAEEKPQEADRMLEQVIESCKYLVAPRETEPIVEAPIQIYGMPTESVLILGSVVLTTLIVAIALVVGWAHMSRKKKEFKDEERY
jgi:hypothetical protein